jgi:hypothetical protein
MKRLHIMSHKWVPALHTTDPKLYRKYGVDVDNVRLGTSSPINDILMPISVDRFNRFRRVDEWYEAR